MGIVNKEKFAEFSAWFQEHRSDRVVPSVNKLSKKFGVHYDTIHRYIKRLGGWSENPRIKYDVYAKNKRKEEHKRARQLAKEGLTLPEILRALGYNSLSPTVRKRIRGVLKGAAIDGRKLGNHAPKKSSYNAFVRFAHENDVDQFMLKELAQMFDCNVHTMRSWLNRLGKTTGRPRKTTRRLARYRDKTRKLFDFLNRVGGCNVSEALHVVDERWEFWDWFKKEYPDEKRIVPAYVSETDRLIAFSNRFKSSHGRRPTRIEIKKHFGKVSVEEVPDVVATPDELADQALRRRHRGYRVGMKFYRENHLGVGVDLGGKIWTRYFHLWLERSGYRWENGQAKEMFVEEESIFNLNRHYYDGFRNKLTSFVKEWRQVVGTTKSRRRYRALFEELSADPFLAINFIPLNAYLRDSITTEEDKRLLTLTDSQIVDYLIAEIADKHSLIWRRHA